MQKIISIRDLGFEVRRVRKAQGYTQTELADLSGVGLSFVSNLENGKETAEIGKALRVVQMLGMDLFCESRGAS